MSVLDGAAAAATRGKLAEAESAIRNVREHADISRSSNLAVRVMIVEGIIECYRVNWPPAADRLQRAKAIAALHRLREQYCSASAWLAHVDYNRSHFPSAIRGAHDVIGVGPNLVPSAYCRAAVILAQLCYLAGRVVDAERWLVAARQGAKLAADSATTSAMIFDACALRTNLMRANAILGVARPDDIELDALFAESSRNFDALADVHVIEPAHDLLKAQIMNLRGKHEEALRAAVGAISNSADSLPPVIYAQLNVERLWALVGTLSPELSQRIVREVFASVSNLTDVDDTACAYRILEWAALKLPDGEELAKTCGSLASRELMELREWRASIGRELDHALDLSQPFGAP